MVISYSKWLGENAKNIWKELKEHLKLRENMKTKKGNIMTLEQFKNKHYGVRGTSKRDQLEAGYQNFKIGALIDFEKSQQ